jgi:hypothetical protein
MRKWNYGEVVKEPIGLNPMRGFMLINVPEGADIEVYNSAYKEAVEMYGTIAAAIHDRTGLIKELKPDNSFGRYKHLSETKKHRKHGKRKNHTVKG